MILAFKWDGYVMPAYMNREEFNFDSIYIFSTCWWVNRKRPLSLCNIEFSWLFLSPLLCNSGWQKLSLLSSYPNLAMDYPMSCSRGGKEWDILGGLYQVFGKVRFPFYSLMRIWCGFASIVKREITVLIGLWSDWVPDECDFWHCSRLSRSRGLRKIRSKVLLLSCLCHVIVPGGKTCFRYACFFG